MLAKITLIGNIGNNAEIVHRNGKNILNFSVAHNRKYKVGEEWKDKTDWFNVSKVIPDNQLEGYKKNLPRLHKGRQVFVEGSMNAKAYTSKSGAPAVDVQVYADVITGLDKPKTVEETQTGVTQNNTVNSLQNEPERAPIGAIDSDDLPF